MSWCALALGGQLSAEPEPIRIVGQRYPRMSRQLRARVDQMEQVPGARCFLQMLDCKVYLTSFGRHARYQRRTTIVAAKRPFQIRLGAIGRFADRCHRIVLTAPVGRYFSGDTLDRGRVMLALR